jgi:hypothetical protein
MTNTLRWHVVARDGEQIAVTRYAIDAARLAISNGRGTTVRHSNKLVLTVTEDTAMEGALPVADRMIALAYRRPAA